jgi:hypothetical protein
MDPLSDVLGAVCLSGAIFLDMELRAEWSYLTAPVRNIANGVRPAKGAGLYTVLTRRSGPSAMLSPKRTSSCPISETSDLGYLPNRHRSSVRHGSGQLRALHAAAIERTVSAGSKQ